MNMEKIKTPKKEKMIGKRTFKHKLTVREAMKNHIKISDMIPKDKLKDMPFSLTWRMILKISNAMIDTGEKVSVDSDMFEVLTIFAEALSSAFLGKNSPT